MYNNSRVCVPSACLCVCMYVVCALCVRAYAWYVHAWVCACMCVYGVYMCVCMCVRACVQSWGNALRNITHYVINIKVCVVIMSHLI